MEDTTGGLSKVMDSAISSVEDHQEVAGEGQEGDIVIYAMRLEAQADQ